MSADNLPDKSRNLSSYIMECGSSEKYELLLGKFQLILRRTFFRNICCNIFMKQLGNIRGKRNIPPAFTTVYQINIVDGGRLLLSILVCCIKRPQLLPLVKDCWIEEGQGSSSSATSRRWMEEFQMPWFLVRPLRIPLPDSL